MCGLLKIEKCAVSHYFVLIEDERGKKKNHTDV